MPLIPLSMIVYIQFDYNSIIINLKNISKGRNIDEECINIIDAKNFEIVANHSIDRND